MSKEIQTAMLAFKLYLIITFLVVSAAAQVRSVTGSHRVSPLHEEQPQQQVTSNAEADPQQPPPPPVGTFEWEPDRFIDMLFSGPAPEPFGTIPHYPLDNSPPYMRGHSSSHTQQSGIYNPHASPHPVESGYDQFTHQLYGAQASPYHPIEWDHDGVAHYSSHWHETQDQAGTSHQGDHRADDAYEEGEASPQINNQLQEDNANYEDIEEDFTHYQLSPKQVQSLFDQMWTDRRLSIAEFDPRDLALEVMHIKNSLPPSVDFSTLLENKVKGSDELYRRQFHDRVQKLRELMEDIEIRLHKAEYERGRLIRLSRHVNEEHLSEAIDRMNGVGYVPDSYVDGKMTNLHLAVRVKRAGELMREYLQQIGLDLYTISADELIKALNQFQLEPHDLVFFKRSRANFVFTLLLHLQTKREVIDSFRHRLVALGESYKTPGLLGAGPPPPLAHFIPGYLAVQQSWYPVPLPPGHPHHYHGPYQSQFPRGYPNQHQGPYPPYYPSGLPNSPP